MALLYTYLDTYKVSLNGLRLAVVVLLRTADDKHPLQSGGKRSFPPFNRSYMNVSSTSFQYEVETVCIHRIQNIVRVKLTVPKWKG